MATKVGWRLYNGLRWLKEGTRFLLPYLSEHIWTPWKQLTANGHYLFLCEITNLTLDIGSQKTIIINGKFFSNKIMMLCHSYRHRIESRVKKWVTYQMLQLFNSSFVETRKRSRIKFICFLAVLSFRFFVSIQRFFFATYLCIKVTKSCRRFEKHVVNLHQKDGIWLKEHWKKLKVKWGKLKQILMKENERPKVCGQSSRFITKNLATSTNCSTKGKPFQENFMSIAWRRRLPMHRWLLNGRSKGLRICVVWDVSKSGTQTSEPIVSVEFLETNWRKERS